MEAFLKELNDIAAALRQEANALAADSRQDEADLNKIRANIYEVCATIGGVVCKTAPEAEREVMFRRKLEALPKNWQVALEAARAHGNTQRAVVEEVKLAALEDVLSRLSHRKGE